MRRFLLPLLLAAAALPLVALQPAHGGQPDATVRVSPASQSVASGQDVTIDVAAEGISDPDGLGAYEFAFTFNPALLDFATFTNGEFLGSTKRSVLCLPPLFDRDDDGVDDPGYVRVGCVTQAAPGTPGPTGDGTLASLTFHTDCAGFSPLAFDLATLSRPLSGDIAVTSVDGSVTVTGTPCATPTPPGVTGDANCNGRADAVDAALILQRNAGLLSRIACEPLADVNEDGRVDAVDAALVLQFVAGLLSQLPP